MRGRDEEKREYDRSPLYHDCPLVRGGVLTHHSLCFLVGPVCLEADTIDALTHRIVFVGWTRVRGGDGRRRHVGAALFLVTRR